MMDYRDEIREIATLLKSLSLIDLEEIPRIELYMEQMTTFFEEEMGEARRNGAEKLLTKTMINNYTKGGILNPPSKKKYNRDHMIALVYIFLLKPVLAIQDIRDLFGMLPAGHDAQRSGALYEVFTRLAGEYCESSAGWIDGLLSHVEGMLSDAGLTDPRYAVVMLSLLLSFEATTLKLTAGRLLDRFRGREWEPAGE